MRRHSLVGPLLLIGIGGIFLAHNLVPDVPLLDYLAQYWPFLLVLWGLLRLVELSTWAMRGRPLPPCGLHGGEWALVFFLCIMGSGLHAVRGFRSWLPQAGIEFGQWEIFGESYEYPEEATAAAADAKPRVVLQQFRGTARIVGVDGNMVTVKGRRTVRAMDQRTADRASEDVKLDVLTSGDQVTINLPSSESRRSRDHGVSHDVDISVPRGATVIFGGRNANLDLRDVNGAVEVDADNATLRLENVGGNVRIDVRGSQLVRAVNVKGSLDLKGRGSDIDLENISGQVDAGGSWSGLVQFRALAQPVRWTGLYTTMTMQAVPGEVRTTTGEIFATHVTGPLRIESTNKDLNLTDIAGPTTVDLQRGDVIFRATTLPLSDVSLSSRGGDVELELPSGAKFNLDARTQKGDAYNGFGEGVEQEHNGRGATIRSNGGGATIHVDVSRGDISLRSGTISSSAPRAKSALRKLPEGVDQ